MSDSDFIRGVYGQRTVLLRDRKAVENYLEKKESVNDITRIKIEIDTMKKEIAKLKEELNSIRKNT